MIHWHAPNLLCSVLMPSSFTLVPHNAQATLMGSGRALGSGHVVVVVVLRNSVECNSHSLAHAHPSGFGSPGLQDGTAPAGSRVCWDDCLRPDLELGRKRRCLVNQGSLHTILAVGHNLSRMSASALFDLG